MRIFNGRTPWRGFSKRLFGSVTSIAAASTAALMSQDLAAFAAGHPVPQPPIQLAQAPQTAPQPAPSQPAAPSPAAPPPPSGQQPSPSPQTAPQAPSQAAPQPAPTAPQPQPSPATDAQPAPQPAAPAQSPPPAASTEASEAEKAKEKEGTPATVVDGQQLESILGKDVRSPTGEDMGRIVDIIVDRRGQVRAAIIDFGGFLGVGSRKIAVDWRVIRFPAEGKADKLVVELVRNQLRVAPIYKPGEPVVVIGRASGDAAPAGQAPAGALAPTTQMPASSAAQTAPPAAAPAPSAAPAPAGQNGAAPAPAAPNSAPPPAPAPTPAPSLPEGSPVPTR